MALTDRVVLITGAGGGIGRALTEAFIREGAVPALWDVAFPQGFAEGLAARGVRCHAETVDITAKAAVEEAAKRTIDALGRVDVLINNAGITRDKLLFRMDDREWDEVLNVNLKGPFLCSKIVGRTMYMRKSGRIINIASIIGQIGNPGQANYAASKGGLIALTKTCAKEFSRAGVTVNAIAPGYISTKMTDALPEDVRRAMLGAIPLGRFGTPDDVAAAAIFLASDAAAYITGQVIRVDGGMVV